MRISTKGIYGLSALVAIAHNSSTGIVSLSSIASRLNLSEGYLQQVFAALRQARLVKSVRGSQGGYELDCDPATTTVGHILRSLEGDLLVVDEDAEQKTDNAIRQCLRRNVWNVLNESINKVIEGITLADILADYRNGFDESLMYYL